MTTWVADISNKEGTNGFWQSAELARRLTFAAVDKIEQTRAFSALAQIVGNEPACTFMLVKWWDLVWPLAKDLTIYCDQSHIDGRHRYASVRDPVVKELLESMWPSREVPLRLELKRFGSHTLRSRLRRIIEEATDAIPSTPSVVGNSKVNLCVECDNEELSRGMLGWMYHLPPEKVILCPFHRGHPIPRSTLSKFESLGFHWASLDKGAVAGNRDYWKPGPIRYASLESYKRAIKGLEASGGIEGWVAGESMHLLRQVDRWRAFFSQHQILVQVTYDPRPEIGIAKRVALKMQGGVQIFMQRSHVAPHSTIIGRRPADILFSWGDPDSAMGLGNQNYNEWVVMTGFSDVAMLREAEAQGQEYRNFITGNGARFIITLFDNAAHPNNMYPSNVLVSFYRHFLNWVLKSPDNGLVIKPKRNAIPKGLTELRDLFEHAQASGRCLLLGQETGVPGAAFAADLCVGLGHSTAATISAILGRRSVLCDLGMTPNDPLASWGRDSVVFYDLDRLAEAIDNCKGDPGASRVGCWEQNADALDPFRDGRASERVQFYLSSLLEAFDEGTDRDSAIRHANKRYAKKWGADKVIDPKTAERLLTAGALAE